MFTCPGCRRCGNAKKLGTQDELFFSVRYFDCTAEYRISGNILETKFGKKSMSL